MPMMGKRELTMGGPYLTWLRESSDAADRPEVLKQRLLDDGYVYLRGFHDKRLVQEARMEMLTFHRNNGLLAEEAPLAAGWIGKQNKGSGFRNRATDKPAFLRLVDAPKTMRLFETLLQGECLTYDTKWYRAVPKGSFSGAHYDIVYMGKGTKNVYTVWTPLMEISLELGGLAILEGSHRFEAVKATYGESDYEKVKGWFSNDPVELVDKFGGKWATTHFEEGDIIFFSMYTMHGSLTNTTDRYRMSADVRYQLASEPFDPRWHGETQQGEEDRIGSDVQEMETARKAWGV